MNMQRLGPGAPTCVMPERGLCQSTSAVDPVTAASADLADEERRHLPIPGVLVAKHTEAKLLSSPTTQRQIVQPTRGT